MTKEKKISFLSDLHLFSRRSSAPDMESKIQQLVKRCDTLVLGGDIFDFRWSTQLSVGHAIDDSIQWLQRLIDANTECKFHYLLGNHDCHPDFVQSLQRLSESASQLSWHRHFLRIDDSVFLHGDIVDTPIRQGQSYHEVLDARRLEGELRKPPTKLSHALYDAAVQARVHRLVVQIAKRKEVVLSRLTKYLRSQSFDAQNGINRVYFGHTHRKLISVPYAGMQFYNPGAAIKGLPFEMLKVEQGKPNSEGFFPV